MTDHHDPIQHNPGQPGCSRAAALAVYRLRAGRVLDPEQQSLAELLDEARESLTRLAVDGGHRLVGVPRAVIVTPERLQAEPDLADRIGAHTLSLIRGYVNVNTWLWLSVDTTCAPLDETC